jgi:DNA-binding response OmpR family regulator
VSFGRVRVDLQARTVLVDGEPLHLTPTEFHLLAFLVKREGQPLPVDRIIDMVLQHEEATPTALQVHVSRLRKKLGEDGERIRTVWGIGYRFDGR